MEKHELTRDEQRELDRLNTHLATREDVGEPLPEHRQIEGLDDEAVRAAEELGLI